MLMKLCVSLLLVSHSLCVLLWAITGSLYYLSEIYGPTLLDTELLGNNKQTKICDVTTDNVEDLRVYNVSQALEVTEHHGSAIIPSVISDETARAFREYVMKANEEMESAPIPDPQNRHRIMPPLTEPVVQDFLKEVASHPVVRPLMEGLLGPQPSVIALSAITSKYGAPDQRFHDDVTHSEKMNPGDFVREFTLSVALQDTTKAMGATGLCPGTHKCIPNFDYDEIEEEFAENETLVELYQGNFWNYALKVIPCNVQATLQQGDAMIYNVDMLHRGVAHTDPDAPERAIVFLSLAGSRHGPDDDRYLPFGLHTLYWNMWGQTLDDCTTFEERPWRLWHVFGFFNGKGNVRPWTLWDAFLLIFRNPQNTVTSISNNFSAKTLSGIVSTMIMYSTVVAWLCVASAFPLLVFVNLSIIWRK